MLLREVKMCPARHPILLYLCPSFPCYKIFPCNASFNLPLFPPFPSLPPLPTPPSARPSTHAAYLACASRERSAEEWGSVRRLEYAGGYRRERGEDRVPLAVARESGKEPSPPARKDRREGEKEWVALAAVREVAEESGSP